MNLKTLLCFCCLCFAVLLPHTALSQRGVADTTTFDDSLVAKHLTVKANELFFEAQKAKIHNDSKKATELYEQFVAIAPSSSAGYYQLAVLYGEDKKIEKAEENIKKAVNLAKGNKWYVEEYASILSRESKNAEAAKLIADLADKDPGEGGFDLLAADYYEQAAKYPDAIKYIDKALVRSGNDEDILMHKVQLYLRMSEVEKAADAMRQLIAMDLHNGKYYKMLGDLYENNKMPAKGLKVYEDAEKIMPGDASIQMGFAEHYLNQKDTVKFRQYAQKAIVNNKLDADTQVDLFATYIQNLSDSAQLKEGLPLLKQLLAQHPADATLIATYGDFLVMDHQVDKAIVEYKRSLAIKPSNMQVWRSFLSVYTEKKYADSLIRYSEKMMKLFPNQFLAPYYNAIGHYNKKDYAKAIKALGRAADMIPDTDVKSLGEIYSFEGEIYHSNKQFDESDKAFDLALKNQPDNASTLNNYSYFLSERGQKLEAAKTMSEKSLRIRPGEPTFMDTYGWILYKLGDFNGAKEYIEKAVNAKNSSGDFTLYEHLGDVYFKLNDKAKAVQYWKTAKEKGSDNPLLNKKISDEKLYE